jgi:hypothetical protein
VRENRRVSGMSRHPNGDAEGSHHQQAGGNHGRRKGRARRQEQ